MEGLLSNTGSGSGSGSGDGSGSGSVIGFIGDYDVRAIVAFGVVVIGCQQLTVGEWEANWKLIAKKHGLTVTDEEANDLLQKVHEIGNAKKDSNIDKG